MAQPPGFVAKDKTLVCKLQRSLYGLKQAPRAWYERLHKFLLNYGFKESSCNPSLFIYRSTDVQLYVLVYVDDILVTGSSSRLIKDILDKLQGTFALKHLGKPQYFLGIEVSYQPNGSLVLTQQKYIKDLLERANMVGCNGVVTPMLSTTKLSKQGADIFKDPHLYRSIVGALQYITLTRPELSYCVNKACQFLSTPLDSHWLAMKRILRYLSGTSSYGHALHPAPSSCAMSLRVYTDSDWANDIDDRRSTSGSCLFLGPNLVSWSSKKQTLVARSSAEAEYRGMTNATPELLWLQSLLHELKVATQRPTLLCDNLSAVHIAHNLVLHARTKHLELDIHFVREKVEAKLLTVAHVPAHGQLADALTKPLPTISFKELRTKLKVVSTQPP